MGNRCHEQGPEGWCSPASHLVVDAKGRLELREGWEEGGNGKKKWAAKKRLSLNVLGGLTKKKKRSSSKKQAGEEKGEGQAEAEEEERRGHELVLTSTGVLELRSPKGEWLWRSNVEGPQHDEYEAFVNDAGKLVVYAQTHIHSKSP